MKRIFASLLALSLVFVLFGCANYAETLAGTWECRVQESNDQRTAVMDQLELYDDEKALVTTPLYTVKTVRFTTDGHYEFNEDVEGVKACVREFFDGMFGDLYAGRASLANTYADYGVDLSTLSEEDFYLFYAALYDFETYEELLDGLADKIYTYEFESSDYGTFTATSSYISFDATDDELDGRVSYSISGDKLTIKYSDDTEVYTRK